MLKCYFRHLGLTFLTDFQLCMIYYFGTECSGIADGKFRPIITELWPLIDVQNCLFVCFLSISFEL